MNTMNIPMFRGGNSPKFIGNRACNEKTFPDCLWKG
jgi:hypothetical protein